MNRTLLSLALTAAFAAAPAQAGPLEDRVDLLSKQVLELQGQVSQLRSMLSRDGTGNVTFTATANRNDLVGKDFSTSVGGSAKQQVSANMSLAVARQLLIEAGDQILLRTGDSTILMKKDGTITITGKLVTVKASGDMLLKGARILQN